MRADARSGPRRSLTQDRASGVMGGGVSLSLVGLATAIRPAPHPVTIGQKNTAGRRNDGAGPRDQTRSWTSQSASAIPVALESSTHDAARTFMRGAGDTSVHIDAGLEVRRHVGEPAVVALERQHDCVGRAVAMFGHYQVSLTCSRTLALICLFAVQKDYDVRVLLDAA